MCLQVIPEGPMNEWATIEYEGRSTKVLLKPCGHCGKVPTAENAISALRHDQKTCKRCAVCGKIPPLYPEHHLYHSTSFGCDGKPENEGWILCGTGKPLDPTWSPGWVTAYCHGPGGTLDGAFHTECIKKVAPGVIIHPNR